jgi:hypothetical protein
MTKYEIDFTSRFDWDREIEKSYQRSASGALAGLLIFIASNLIGWWLIYIFVIARLLP